MKKRIIIYILLLIPILILYRSLNIYYIIMRGRIDLCPYMRYVEENQSFPVSELELFEKEYIRIRKDDSSRYQDSVIRNNKLSWSDLIAFKDYNFAYGISLEDLTVLNGKVVSKQSKEPILLFSGPGMQYDKTKEFYERATLQLYNAAIKK